MRARSVPPEPCLPLPTGGVGKDKPIGTPREKPNPLRSTLPMRKHTLVTRVLAATLAPPAASLLRRPQSPRSCAGPGAELPKPGTRLELVTPSLPWSLSRAECSGRIA